MNALSVENRFNTSLRYIYISNNICLTNRPTHVATARKFLQYVVIKYFLVFDLFLFKTLYFFFIYCVVRLILKFRTCSFLLIIFFLQKKDSYREHVQIHEGPRHACSYCPMRFVQRSNMLRHERRHTGERPYACSQCPRTFADKGACTSHIR